MCDGKWRKCIVSYESKVFKFFPVTKRQGVHLCNVCGKILLERGLKPEDRKKVLDEAWRVMDRIQY